MLVAKECPFLRDDYNIETLVSFRGISYISPVDIIPSPNENARTTTVMICKTPGAHFTNMV